MFSLFKQFQLDPQLELASVLPVCFTLCPACTVKSIKLRLDDRILELQNKLATRWLLAESSQNHSTIPKLRLVCKLGELSYIER